MKIDTASIALLGLPAAWAAVAAIHDQARDVHPTSPTPTQRLLGTSTQSEGHNNNNNYFRNVFDSIWQDTIKQADQDPAEQNFPHHGLKKRVAQSDESSTSRRTTVPLVNTFTDLSSSSAAPTVTKLAAFTIEGLGWTVTSAGGVQAVGGKTLSPGGAPINIAGHHLSDPTNGPIVLDAESTLSFSRYIPPSSSSAAGESSVTAGPGPSAPASASASASASAAAGGGTSTSGGAAAPLATAGVGAVIGVVVGAFGAAVL